MDEFRNGQLEVICGPMFCGKSEELIRRIRRVHISGKKYLVFKPAKDDRYDKNHITSHDMNKVESIITGTDKESIAEIEKVIEASGAEVIAFDEVNFYDDHIAELITRLVNSGKRVIVSGLDMNFRGEPFGPMPKLLAMADHVDKLKAICMKCKNEPASMTQRIINGVPARRSDPTILIGAAESYEARCRKCHELHD